MLAKYVIAVKSRTINKWFYLGYICDGGNQTPVFMDELYAYEFDFKNDALEAYNRDKDQVSEFLDEVCDRSTLCIKRRTAITRYEYLEIQKLN